MTYVWATVLVLVNLLWLASVLLQLPGTWLMVLGTLLTAYLQPGMFGTGSLVAVVALALVGELLELISGMVGAKRAGATRWGTWGGLAGAIIGAVAGTFLVPVPLFGSLIGACMGAVLVAFALERTKGKRTFQESLHSGLGAGVGRLFGTVGKFAVGVIIWIVVAVDAFAHL